MHKTRFLYQLAKKSVEYLPSDAFMHVKVRRPGQKAHFVQVASELELLKDVYGPETMEKLKINDDTWQILMEMGWEERTAFLMDMLKFQRNTGEKKIKNEELISSQNSSRLANGEMVYARNFHSLLDIYGADFRRKIDNFYGRNLLKQGEDLKNLIVDCRFLREFSVKTQANYTNQMQSLHDDNWTSGRPFSISFTNYQADKQLSAIAKRNLLFQYGPSSASTSDFRPHPFAPVITSRRIDSVEKKENLLYISSRATRFLPDTVPPNVRGVVLCLSKDMSPSTSSQTACIADKVESYQLPFKRVIRSETFRQNLVPLWQLARIFRHYFKGAHIDDSIRTTMHNVAKMRTEKHKKNDRKEDEKDEMFRSSMYQINNVQNSNENRMERKKPLTPPTFSKNRQQFSQRR